jgi:hypothetical protein
MGESGREPTQLPGRECRCRGDGETYVDTSACRVHTVETSPIAQALADAWQRGLIDALRSENERFKAALRTISGPDDRGPWIEVYREAGGGYSGLQAIAEAALEGRD